MGYEVKLDIFEGPLDLLLYLIRKNKIDIYDIPISLITEQYLQYLRVMKSLSLDLAGEYLVLASTLVHIKSQMLLPSPVLEGEDEVDPRAELVRQLIDYQAFKEAAAALEGRPMLERDLFTRGDHTEEMPGSEDDQERFEEMSVFALIEAFGRMVARMDASEKLQIDMEKISLADRIDEIMERLAREGSLSFDALMERQCDRRRLIYTFLAILEMVRLRMIRIYQRKPFGAIRIVLAVEG
ncbi:MAG: segregation/condensation protein A [Deltaproteobacteria bacterium]|nr:segregation/condensation protein A [Deltaproteobacteria bacterium]